MLQVTSANRRRVRSLAMALLVGFLVGYPGEAISEEGAPDRALAAVRGVPDAARLRPMAAIYDARHATVVPPIPRFRDLPPWYPTQPGSPAEFAGDVEFVVGENGRVLSASILDSVEANYDGLLLESARKWTFIPATRSGVPVKYRYVVTFRLVP